MTPQRGNGRPLANQPRKVASRDISRPIESMLWGRAAGRCEFQGCNQELYKSRVTQEPVNIAQKAHIYAFSSAGPRGNSQAARVSLNAIENLMLVCGARHTTSDKQWTRTRYTVAMLQKWKQEHERRTSSTRGFRGESINMNEGGGRPVEQTRDQQVMRPYRVLSLDGGGMRGLYTGAFLARLTDQFRRIRGESALDFGRGFDLITGTSTGAIVGCALAVGRPMSEIVRLYQERGPKIFPHRIAGRGSTLYRVTQGSRYVRAGDKALREALEAVLGETTMLDVYCGRGISLSIPAVLMSDHRAWVFKKTPRSGVRDDNYPLVDVCMATSAAPIYRSLAAIDDPNTPGGPQQVFADGGLWANNPIMVGLIDALMIAAPERPIEIFSLGTCQRPEGDHLDAASAHRSMLDWSLGADVAPLSISAQEFAFDHMARLVAGAISSCGRPIRRVRFPNKPVPASMMPYLALDDTRQEAMGRLMAQAHTDADLTKSVCDDLNSEDGKMIRRLMNELPAMLATGAVWDRVSVNNAGG